jgi:hypothetical protein
LADGVAAELDAQRLVMLAQGRHAPKERTGGASTSAGPAGVSTRAVVALRWLIKSAMLDTRP